MRGPRPNYSLSKAHKETIRKLNRNIIFSQEFLNKIITKVSKPVYVYTPEPPRARPIVPPERGIRIN